LNSPCRAAKEYCFTEKFRVSLDNAGKEWYTNCVVKVKVNAKINLCLFITGVKQSYHMLDSVVASVGIADVISARKSDKTTLFFKSGLDERNTNAYKVAEYMVKEYSLPGAEIEIEDNIPSSCGMGGSSADCAGVILALNELYSLSLSLPKMQEIALKFGSDTAYMLTGGYAVMQGRGEIIKPFDSEFTKKITIAYKGGVSTKESFDLFDKRGAFSLDGSNKMVDALKKTNEQAVFSLLYNDLEKPSKALNPHIEKIESLSPFPCVMTGSGAAVVIMGQSAPLSKSLSLLGATVIETEIVSRGVDIIKIVN